MTQLELQWMIQTAGTDLCVGVGGSVFVSEYCSVGEDGPSHIFPCERDVSVHSINDSVQAYTSLVLISTQVSTYLDQQLGALPVKVIM